MQIVSFFYANSAVLMQIVLFWCKLWHLHFTIYAVLSQIYTLFCRTFFRPIKYRCVPKMTNMRYGWEHLSSFIHNCLVLSQDWGSNDDHDDYVYYNGSNHHHHDQMNSKPPHLLSVCILVHTTGVTISALIHRSKRCLVSGAGQLVERHQLKGAGSPTHLA